MQYLDFGLHDVVPDSATAAWGARAYLKSGAFQLVPDRQTLLVQDAKHSELLRNWLDSTAMKWLRKKAKRIHISEDLVHALDDGEFHLRISALASFGYLYIAAWIEIPQIADDSVLEHRPIAVEGKHE